MFLELIKWGKESITELGEIIPVDEIGNFVLVEIREVYASGFFQDLLMQLLGGV